MNSANDSFFLSFHGPHSLCRLSHGKCLKSAVADALQAAAATGMTSSILDSSLKVLGQVVVVQDAPLSPSHFAFFNSDGVQQNFS